MIDIQDFERIRLMYWTLTRHDRCVLDFKQERHDWCELDFNKTRDRCVPEFNKIRPMCKYFNKTRLMYTRQDWCVLDLN